MSQSFLRSLEEDQDTQLFQAAAGRCFRWRAASEDLHSTLPARAHQQQKNATKRCADAFGTWQWCLLPRFLACRFLFKHCHCVRGWQSWDLLDANQQYLIAKAGQSIKNGQ